MSEITFRELNLPESIQRAIDEQDFKTATDIQAKTIPLIREGKDIIGKSQTGTGKTIAFGIPAIEVIDPDIPRKNIQVLILCPTRELALQASAEIKKLAKYTENIGVTEVYGGSPMQAQIAKIKRSNMVIGTPGRIMDHLRRKTMDLTHLKMIILDEADEMLSMGFREDIETILKDVPEERQTVLFSATMPPAIINITKNFQRDPELVSINAKQITLDNISQFYYNAPIAKKKEVLNVVLQYHNPKRCIIFVNTKKMVDEATEFLKSKGYSTDGLHGDMQQGQRTRVMNDFKSGHLNILVATDVAARGIDVNDIDIVVNYDVPQNSEYYVHRIGRTGRAGKSGIAITLAAGSRNLRELLQLTRLTKSDIKELPLPNNKLILQKQNENNIVTVEENISKGNFHYGQIVDSLIEKGFSERDIALSTLEMFFGEPKSIEELRVEPKQRNKHKSDLQNGKNNRIMLNIGRNQRCAPNHIVGAITDITNLTGNDIGKIDVYAKYSVVSVPINDVDEVISALNNKKICGIIVSCKQYTDDDAQTISVRKRDNPRFNDNSKSNNRRRFSDDKAHSTRQNFKSDINDKTTPRRKKKFST